MIDLITILSSRLRMTISIAVFFLVLEAMFMFPIDYSGYDVFLFVTLCVAEGLMFTAVFKGLWIKVLAVTVSSCIIGFGLRVWLEWGEASLVRDLTVKNFLITYIPIILMIMVCHGLIVSSKQYLSYFMIREDGNK